MARLIPTKDIINTNVDNFLDQSSRYYNKFLEGTPSFVTYYSKDRVNSTEDVGLENVIELVGNESPIKYVKVNDFPLYSLEESDIETQIGDFGLESEFQSTAVILPGTLKPLADDYFTIYYNREYVFKITNVQIDKIADRQFYRISFRLSEERLEVLDKQVTEDYDTLYENIGTEDRVIVRESTARLVKAIDSLNNKLIEFYKENFHDKEFDIITYRYNGYRLYNSFLVNFIKNNYIMQQKYSYMSNIYVNNLHLGTPKFHELYKRTIYYALETKSTRYLEYEDFFLSTITNRDTPFYDHYESFYRCKYYNPLKNSKNLVIVRPHNSRLIDKIKKNELFLDGEPLLSRKELDCINPNIKLDLLNFDLLDPIEFKDSNEKEDPRFLLENIIIKYLNDELELNEDLILDINSIEYRPFLNGYLLIPAVIHILKEYKSTLI